MAFGQNPVPGHNYSPTPLTLSYWDFQLTPHLKCGPKVAAPKRPHQSRHQRHHPAYSGTSLTECPVINSSLFWNFHVSFDFETKETTGHAVQPILLLSVTYFLVHFIPSLSEALDARGP